MEDMVQVKMSEPAVDVTGDVIVVEMFFKTCKFFLIVLVSEGSLCMKKIWSEGQR